jgi:hypothetical protein
MKGKVLELVLEPTSLEFSSSTSSSSPYTAATEELKLLRDMTDCPPGVSYNNKVTTRPCRQLRMSLVKQKKSLGCMDCGAILPPYVMDMDHRMGTTKLGNISDMAKDCVALTKFNEELAKCDPICSNCHRERTYRRSLEGSKAWNIAQ